MKTKQLIQASTAVSYLIFAVVFIVVRRYVFPFHARLALAASTCGMLLLTLAVMAGGIATLRADPVPLDQDATVETSAAAGVWIHYEVTIPSDSPGWRLVLAPRNGAAGNVALYVRKDSLPTTGSYFRRDIGAGTLKTMVLTAAEATAGTWYVGLHLPSGTAEDVLLQSETGWLTELTWDPGNAELGTNAFTIPGADVGGQHFFRIVTPNSQHGLWRQVLKVTSGEADLYIRQNAAPTTSSYTARSIRSGNDGILRALSTTAGAGQVWYIMVSAVPGAEWNLFGGDLFVRDLGAAQTDGSGGSGPDVMPIEGARFYQTAMPQETLAWRVWLQDGDGGTWNNNLFFRKNAVGHPLITTPERTYTGQALIVPPYLTTGTDVFFVSLKGEPGTAFALDSRQQTVTDLAIDATSAAVVADGYWFHTFRIEVPPDRLGWEVTVRRDAGNPDLAVRKGQVPNRRDNDAFSEVAGAADDSTTLVQTDLGNGAYFVTVHSADDHAFRLQTREPVVTPLAFTDTRLNDDPERTGWRYYGITDIESQQGFLGWLLELADQVPGTEIAVRRNNLPGRWDRRANNGTITIARVDDSSTVGILQRPGHAADIWYVGIRTATAPLGAFTLNTEPLAAPMLPIENSGATVSNLPPNIFAYYRVDVPSQIGVENLLGWELRVSEWTGGNPQIYIRRGQLPVVSGGTVFTSPGAVRITNWPVGVQASEASWDWTRRHQSTDGTQNYAAKLLSFGMGQPLEPDTYYIAFRNTSTTVDSTFTWTSRVIGGDGSGLDYEITTLPFGGTASGTLAAREVAYFAMDIPEDTPSHKVRLTLPQGHEGSLFIRKDFLPNSMAGHTAWWDPSDPLHSSYQQTRLTKAGGESFVHLPRAGETTLRAGRYYLMVVSEGQNPSTASRIGTGSISYTLQSLGPAPVANLGSLPEAGETTFADSYDAGEVKLYRFSIPADVLALEVVLEDRVGTPKMALSAGAIPHARLTYWQSGTYDAYGYSCARETGFGTHETVLTAANPAAGEYSVAIGHGGGIPVAGSYTLRVTTVGAPLVAMDASGGDDIALLPNAWRYYRVEVPEQINGHDVLGWEVHVPEWDGAAVQIYIRRDELPGIGAPAIHPRAFIAAQAGPAVPRSIRIPTIGPGGRIPRTARGIWSARCSASAWASRCSRGPTSSASATTPPRWPRRFPGPAAPSARRAVE